VDQPAARPRIETVTAHHTAADDAVTAARMSAAEVQRLTAAVAALKAQVTGLGERVARSDVAQSTVAERVEALAAEMARLGRLPDSLGGLRADLTGLLEKVETRIRGDMEQQLAGRGQALAKAIGRLAEVEDRLASLEEFQRADVTARLEALEARRDKDETRGQYVEARIHALETHPPWMAAQTGPRLDHLAEEVASLGREVAGWQSRLETAGETARAAEAVVKAVRVEADDLRRDHRAHAEVVRIAQGKIEKAVGTFEAAADERWNRFLMTRANERRQRDAETLRLSEALAEAAAGLESAQAELAALAEAVAAQGNRGAADLSDLRGEIATVAANMQQTLSGAIEIMESGLPAEQRRGMVEERQRALRRALKARRPQRDG